MELGVEDKDDNIVDNLEIEGDPDAITSSKMEIYLRIRPVPRSLLNDNFRKNHITIENSKTLSMTGSLNIKNPVRANFAPGNHPDEAKFTLQFTKIFDSDVRQALFFQETVQQNIYDLLNNGQSITVMNYGVVKSGKTYTMSGTLDDLGVVPRSIACIFNSVSCELEPSYKPIKYKEVKTIDPRYKALEIDKTDEYLTTLNNYPAISEKYGGLALEISNQNKESFSDYIHGVWVSFIEIYNDVVYDLLDSDVKGNKKKLEFNVDQNSVIYLEGQQILYAKSGLHAFKIFLAGKQRLTFASENDYKSSKSHSIFTIKVLRFSNTDNSGESLKISSVYFYDLAGHALKKGKPDSVQIEINKSLYKLKRCLNEVSNSNLVLSHGLFRESKLNRSLQQALCSHEKIILLFTISPSPDSYNETFSILRSFNSILRLTKKTIINYKTIDSFVENINTPRILQTERYSRLPFPTIIRKGKSVNNLNQIQDFTVRGGLTLNILTSFDNDNKLLAKAKLFTLIVKCITYFESLIKNKNPTKYPENEFNIKKLFDEECLTKFNNDELDLISKLDIVQQFIVKNISQSTAAKFSTSDFEEMGDGHKDLYRTLFIQFLQKVKDVLSALNLDSENFKFTENMNDKNYLNIVNFDLEVSLIKIKKVIDIQKERLREYEKDSGLKSIEISDLKEKLDAEKKFTYKKIKEIEDEKSNLIKQLNDCNSKILELSAIIDKNSLRNSEFEAHRDSISELLVDSHLSNDSGLSIAETQFLKLDQYSQTELSVDNRKIDNYKQVAREAQRRYEQIDQIMSQKIKSFETKYSEIKKDLTACKSEINLKDTLFKESTERIYDLEKQREKLAKENYDYKRSLEESCSQLFVWTNKTKVLERNLSESNYRFESLLKKCFSQHEVKIRELEGELHEKDVHIKEIKRSVCDYQQNISKMNDLAKKVDDFESQIQKVHSEKSFFINTLLERGDSQMETDERLESLSNKIESHDNYVVQLQSDFGDLNNSATENKNKTKDLDDLLSKLRDQIHKRKEEIMEIKEIRRKIEKESKRKIHSLESRLNNYKDHDTLLRMLSNNNDSRREEVEQLKILLDKKEEELELFRRNRDETIAKYESFVKQMQCAMSIPNNMMEKLKKRYYNKNSREMKNVMDYWKGYRTNTAAFPFELNSTSDDGDYCSSSTSVMEIPSRDSS